jgi:hypothetical protein
MLLRCFVFTILKRSMRHKKVLWRTITGSVSTQLFWYSYFEDRDLGVWGRGVPFMLYGRYYNNLVVVSDWSWQLSTWHCLTFRQTSFTAYPYDLLPLQMLLEARAEQVQETEYINWKNRNPKRILKRKSEQWRVSQNRYVCSMYSLYFVEHV